MRNAIHAALALTALCAGCNAVLGIDQPELRTHQVDGGTPCVLNSDCADETMVCVFATCSPRCARSRDCPDETVCLQTVDGAACVTSSQQACDDAGANCPAGTRCSASVCRTVCADDRGCPGDQECVGNRCQAIPMSGPDGPTPPSLVPSGLQPSPSPDLPIDGGAGMKAPPMQRDAGQVPEAAVPEPDAAIEPPPECESAQTECDEQGMLRSCTSEGKWGESHGCPFLCRNGECTGECSPEAMTCADGVTPQRCSAEGTWKPQSACSGVCMQGQCAGSCSPKSLQCAGTTLLECDDQGAWKTAKTCQFVCDPMAPACTGMCTPGSRTCDGTDLQVCDADGMWGTLSACPFECLTVAGTPGCSECTRGDKACVGSGKARTCDGNGVWQTRTCAHECIGDACVDCKAGDGLCPAGCAYGDDSDCPKPLGRACGNGGECASGQCVDGVCCNSACGGPCQACNLPGSVGTCGLPSFAADVNNCGSCGASCSTNNISRACSGGQCTGTCDAPFLDCNSDRRTDGCEINPTNNVNHCGGCGDRCSSNHVTGSDCKNRQCTGTCTGSFRDCNSDLRTDGCEIDTDSDPNNCSGCGRVCTYGLCERGSCVSTRWGYTLAQDTINLSAGRMIGVRFSISRDSELAALALNTVTAGSQIYLALYRDASNAPQSLVAQTDALTTVDGLTEGLVSRTPISQGSYWLFLVADQITTVRTTNLATTWLYVAHPFGPMPRMAPGMTGLSEAEINVSAVTVP